MNSPIYFSYIEFSEFFILGRQSIISLDIAGQELAYQVSVWKPQPTDRCADGNCGSDNSNGSESSLKPAFTPVLFTSDLCRRKIIFTHVIKLNGEQVEKLLPLCKAEDFEPYRGREMKMGEEGYCGYRDEVFLKFRGITDTDTPMLELPMDYYYTEKYIWPSERLYRFVIKEIFSTQKELDGKYTPYFGFSLPC